MISRPNLPDRIEAGMRRFAERMTAVPPLADATLTTRIVGEFSAGKTRLLRELLGAHVPEALAPISSRDPQTRLPLEVTYGAAARLSVVERAFDSHAGKDVAFLDRFPMRDQVDLLGYQPESHRLRLALPLEQLILPEGDGYQGNAPSRMFLIDMPGWNSGDDESAEEEAEIVLNADYSLALVYVTQAGRLDSATNRRRLHDFVTAMSGADFYEGARLVIVVTHCSSAESVRLTALARELVAGIWAEVDTGLDLAVDVLCAEFNEMQEADKDAFRARFWQCLLAPLGHSTSVPAAHYWLAKIEAWPDEYDIRPRLARSHTLLATLRELADRACRAGNYLPNMNMQRLVYLDDEEITAKLRQTWQRQTKPDTLAQAEALFASLGLDPSHPLFDWWSEVWLDQLRLFLVATRTFFAQAQTALDRVDRETANLDEHLRRHLDKPAARMRAALGSSFARQVDVATKLIDQPLAQVVPTLLVLGAIQGHYVKRYAMHLQALRQEASDEA